MLSGPRALDSASETSDYLLHEYLVRNDKAHRTANRWHGGGAEALGLPERVSRRRFVAVLEGHVPGTDIRLGRVVDGEFQHRPGWDCTFSAPKSVSLEALLHDNKAVMRAHDASVRAALDWMEAEFLQTRGYDPATGRRPRVKADGLVAATFRHVASRNNDPQLHTHAVIANMTRNAAGEWRSVEPTQLRRNRRLIGAWYRNDLARRLGEMGYVMVPTQVGGLPSFELAGYSPAMLEAFSTRRRDILDYMADKGWKYDAKTAQAATLHTRKRKDEPALGELAAMWKARAEALGLARDADEVRLDRTERGFARPPARFTALEAVWQATEHLEERHAVFGESDLLAAALGREPGRHTHVDLQAEIGRLREDGHLVAAGDGALTTRRTLRAEKEVIRLMREGKGTARPLAPEEAVAGRLAATELTEGQKEAVRLILRSPDPVVGVQGFAGTGKTRMLNEVATLAGGRQVFGLAPSSEAARVLGVEGGIGVTTLQWLLTRYGSIAEGTASAEEIGRARETFRGRGGGGRRGLDGGDGADARPSADPCAARGGAPGSGGGQPSAALGGCRPAVPPAAARGHGDGADGRRDPAALGGPEGGGGAHGCGRSGAGGGEHRGGRAGAAGGLPGRDGGAAVAVAAAGCAEGDGHPGADP